MILRLKKGCYNKVSFSADLDATNMTIEWRLKADQEDTTNPLLEDTVTITSVVDGVSSGYLEIDLGGEDLVSNKGVHFLDFKIYENATPTKPIYSDLIRVNIETTLKV